MNSGRFLAGSSLTILKQSYYSSGIGGGNMSAKKEIVGDIFQGFDRLVGGIFSGKGLRG